jgi:hypothetical protein
MLHSREKSGSETHAARRQFIIPGVLELPSSSESNSRWDWESNNLDSNQYDPKPMYDNNVINHFWNDFTEDKDGEKEVEKEEDDDDDDDDDSGSGSGSGSGSEAKLST